MQKNTLYQSTFSQRQLLGILILVVLIVVSVFLWRVIPYFNQTPVTNADDSLYKVFVTQSTDSVAEEKIISYSQKEHYSDNYEKKEEITLFPFNPNVASKEELIRLGLSPRVAATIIKYRNKGGKFYKKEDFGKIYTLKKADYNRLLPSIVIPSSNSSKEKGYNFTNRYPDNPRRENLLSTKSNQPVSINSCNAEDLMQLKGIGVSYASRIIKYRDILGGYVDVDQLKEVYGMKDSLFNAIKDKIVVDPRSIKKIPINAATEEEFYKHPYIRKMAKNIILYRNDIGTFKSIEDFKSIPLINAEKYRKIAPYLAL